MVILEHMLATNRSLGTCYMYLNGPHAFSVGSLESESAITEGDDGVNDQILLQSEYVSFQATTGRFPSAQRLGPWNIGRRNSALALLKQNIYIYVWLYVCINIVYIYIYTHTQ